MCSLIITKLGSTSRRVYLMALLLFILLQVPDVNATPQYGELAQLKGRNGCVNRSGDDGCARSKEFTFPEGVVVSPDGRNVYVASSGWLNGHPERAAVSIFDRNLESGVITQPNKESDRCVGTPYNSKGCSARRGLIGAAKVYMSQDSKTLYVASPFSSTISVLNREPTSGRGTLTQSQGATGCITSAKIPRSFPEGCNRVRSIVYAKGLAISPDGKHVYVASELSAALAAFSRDLSTGTLTQLEGDLGCVSGFNQLTILYAKNDNCSSGRGFKAPIGVAISPDGLNVYVASATYHHGYLSVLKRDPETGSLSQLQGEAGCISQDGSEGCVKGRALERAVSVTVSPDGKSVYVASKDALAVFDRHSITGAVHQLDGESGCIGNEEKQKSDGCAKGRGIYSGDFVNVSPEGKNVYLASTDRKDYANSAIAAFSRSESGVLTQLKAEGGCVGVGRRVTEGCKKVRSLAFPESISISPNGRSVYVASKYSQGIAVFDRHIEE